MAVKLLLYTLRANANIVIAGSVYLMMHQMEKHLQTVVEGDTLGGNDTPRYK